jgi:hypothetical protein
LLTPTTDEPDGGTLVTARSGGGVCGFTLFAAGSAALVSPVNVPVAFIGFEPPTSDWPDPVLTELPS